MFQQAPWTLLDDEHLAYPVYLAEDWNQIWPRDENINSKKYNAYDYCDQVGITAERSLSWVKRTADRLHRHVVSPESKNLEMIKTVFSMEKITNFLSLTS